MKYVFTIFLSLFTIIVTAQTVNIQENCNKYFDDNFVSDGQQYRALLTGEEIAESIKEIPGKLNVYAFYDKKTKQFDTPVFCRSDMFAGRHYQMVVEREGTIPCKFKKDFDMYKLGTFDLFTGKFSAEIQIIITGKE